MKEALSLLHGCQCYCTVLMRLVYHYCGAWTSLKDHYFSSFRCYRQQIMGFFALFIDVCSVCMLGHIYFCACMLQWSIFSALTHCGLH